MRGCIYEVFWCGEGAESAHVNALYPNVSIYVDLADWGPYIALVCDIYSPVYFQAPAAHRYTQPLKQLPEKWEIYNKTKTKCHKLHVPLIWSACYIIILGNAIDTYDYYITCYPKCKKVEKLNDVGNKTVNMDVLKFWIHSNLGKWVHLIQRPAHPINLID